jgi:hypothetical protein
LWATPQSCQREEVSYQQVELQREVRGRVSPLLHCSNAIQPNRTRFVEAWWYKYLVGLCLALAQVLLIVYH